MGEMRAHVDAERLAGVALRVEVGEEHALARARASHAATFTHSVVLQVPPFSLMKAIRRTARRACRLAVPGAGAPAVGTFSASPSSIDSSSASCGAARPRPRWTGRFTACIAVFTPLSSVDFAVQRGRDDASARRASPARSRGAV